MNVTIKITKCCEFSYCHDVPTGCARCTLHMKSKMVFALVLMLVILLLHSNHDFKLDKQHMNKNLIPTPFPLCSPIKLSPWHAMIKISILFDKKIIRLLLPFSCAAQLSKSNTAYCLLFNDKKSLLYLIGPNLGPPFFNNHLHKNYGLPLFLFQIFNVCSQLWQFFHQASRNNTTVCETWATRNTWNNIIPIHAILKNSGTNTI